MGRARAFLFACIAIASLAFAWVQPPTAQAVTPDTAKQASTLAIEAPPDPIPAELPPDQILQLQKVAHISGIRSRLMRIAADSSVSTPSRIEAFELVLKMDALSIPPHDGLPGLPGGNR